MIEGLRPLLLSLAIVAAISADSASILENGDFHLGNGSGPVTTTSVGVPPNSLPKDWYGGPGVGATATYEIRESPTDDKETGAPDRYLRVSWSAAPSQDWPGEAHHQPHFRFTFLEYFGVRDVNALAGTTVRVRFRARAVGDPVDIIPILWHSYDASTPGIAAVKGKGYEIFEASGEFDSVAVASGAPHAAAVCRLTTEWEVYKQTVTLPATAGRSITAGHYTGVGFDLHERAAPTIEIAEIEVFPVGVTK